MARQLAEALGSIEHIETAILLSLGDEYGPDSLTHILEAVAQPFSVVEQGERRDAVPFSNSRAHRIPFAPRGTNGLSPSLVGRRPLPKTLSSASGRFALDPAWAGTVAAMIARAARRSLTGSRFLGGERGAIHRLQRLYAGQDRFALVVTARGRGRTMTMSLAGRHQADATAAGAAEFVRALASGEIEQPGVWLPEQVIPHERFFEALGHLGFHASMEERPTS